MRQSVLAGLAEQPWTLGRLLLCLLALPLLGYGCVRKKTSKVGSAPLSMTAKRPAGSCPQQGKQLSQKAKLPSIKAASGTQTSSTSASTTKSLSSQEDKRHQKPAASSGPRKTQSARPPAPSQSFPTHALLPPPFPPQSNPSTTVKKTDAVATAVAGVKSKTKSPPYQSFSAADFGLDDDIWNAAAAPISSAMPLLTLDGGSPTILSGKETREAGDADQMIQSFPRGYIEGQLSSQLSEVTAESPTARERAPHYEGGVDVYIVRDREEEDTV